MKEREREEKCKIIYSREGNKVRERERIGKRVRISIRIIKHKSN